MHLAQAMNNQTLSASLSSEQQSGILRQMFRG